LRTSSFREGLREEVEAALEIEGDSPLRTLLADDEHVAAMRAEFVTTGTPLLRQFSKTESFRSWLPSDS